MATITKIIKLSKQLPIKPTNPAFIYSVRNAVNMRDYAPGAYPKTKEERIKAAKKYNMHPDEYIPFEETDKLGYGRGDYPNLPVIGHACKDPYYPYDIPADRRNYNETLPESFDMLGPERLDMLGSKPRFSNFQACCTFFGFVGFMFAIYWIADDYKYFRPAIAKQYPSEGVKHYTFEPANS